MAHGKRAFFTKAKISPFTLLDHREAISDGHTNRVYGVNRLCWSGAALRLQSAC